ncbi:Bax inhibitor-1/YccA family protein [Virgibacillus halodenitrificans]|uniref:Bax inhibitor-1/YccA family protein n=1 Tax=Virgibacillus halodenitrificans TaxID=1482 RepID=UPI000EF545DB|nr:Bax inhibitor-1 family protein [Virgibacillus halodenitrificans]
MYQKSNPIGKLMSAFFFAFLLAVIGVYAGQYIPPQFIWPLAILELVLVIIVAFTRNRKGLGYFVMYLFMFVSGLTLYAMLAHYVSVLGADEVLKAFIIAVVAFAALAIYGSMTKFNLGFLGNFLFFGLLVLVLVLIAGIFIPFSNIVNLIIAIAGIGIFAGYTLYDFNQIARNGFEEEDIPTIVVNIYLDFINLFTYILRFMKYFNSDN